MPTANTATCPGADRGRNRGAPCTDDRRLAGRRTDDDPRRRGPRALIAAVTLVTAMVAMVMPSGADVTDPAPDATTSTTSAADTSTSEPTADTTAPDPTTTAPTTTAPANGITLTVDTTTTTTPTPGPTPAAVAVPAAASIVVTPSTLLVQGDVVTVAGTGYPANDLIGIIQCKVPSSSVADCNMSTLGYTNADASGNFSTSFTPRRTLLVAGTPIHCADPGACKLGVGAW